MTLYRWVLRSFCNGRTAIPTPPGILAPRTEGWGTPSPNDCASVTSQAGIHWNSYRSWWDTHEIAKSSPRHLQNIWAYLGKAREMPRKTSRDSRSWRGTDRPTGLEQNSQETWAWHLLHLGSCEKQLELLKVHYDQLPSILLAKLTIYALTWIPEWLLIAQRQHDF